MAQTSGEWAAEVARKLREANAARDAAAAEARRQAAQAARQR